MNRWKNRWPMMDRVEDPGSSGDPGTGLEDDLEGDPPLPTDPPSSPTPTDTDPPAAVSSPFEDPEVAAKIALLETTVQQQGANLTAMHNAAQVQPVPAPAAPPEEVSPEEYWANPAKHQREMITDIVGKQLKEIIQPFQDDLAGQKTERAWAQVRGTYPGVDVYRTLIETKLQGYNVTNPTAETIKTLYLEAVGEASLQGSNAPVTPSAPTPQTPAPPQHPPSSHPITPTTPTPAVRDLTEGEARMAREAGMTHEEYLAGQGDPDGVDFMKVEVGS